ncbi:MAG: glycosyltransferase [Candidatus Aenigmarchaeota archaeon]|nr:glycosyltransferase [Candidatus Aenigmarchaeota archaeon]
MLSVIIPAYNAEKTIASTIKALLDQNYPKNKYEIIIVDDGSVDKTVEVASQFPVKVIKLKHNGPAHARNMGAKKAKGSIILFTDSDCIPDKNWIREMIKPLKNSGVVGVSGTYKTLNQDKLMARFIGYEIEQRHDNMKKLKYIDFVGTFSAAYKKDIFLKFGGFDERFKKASGEDPELSFRISKASLKMVFNPKAFVYHPHIDSFWKYLKWKYERAVWRNLMYWEKHKEKVFSDSYTPRMLLPQILLSGLVVLASLIPILLGQISLIFIPLVLLLVIAFIFNLDVIVFIWRREKKLAVLSPLVFFFRNISVLVGVIVGVLKFLFKKF